VTSLALAALLLAPPADAPSALRLTLTTAKTTLLAGEPARLDLTWTATGTVLVGQDVRLVLASPDGTERDWHEAALAIEQAVDVAGPLGPGEYRVTAHVLAATGSMTFPPSAFAAPVSKLELAFPTPGRYRVKAQYGSAVSITLEIDVVRPAGGEA
jgi:hypothetical protein